MPSLNRSTSVLFLDDDDDTCEMLTVLMNCHGIDATCVQSVAEAWRMIKSKHFDLYLLDGWLPDVDGFEFCRQIRTHDPRTPIVFYSGAAFPADQQRGMLAGANAYVIKPDIEGLMETMVLLTTPATNVTTEKRSVLRARPSTEWSSSRRFRYEAVSD